MQAALIIRLVGALEMWIFAETLKKHRASIKLMEFHVCQALSSNKFVYKAKNVIDSTPHLLLLLLIVLVGHVVAVVVVVVAVSF